MPKADKKSSSAESKDSESSSGQYKVEISYPIHYKGVVYEPGEVVTDQETANRLYQINKDLAKEYK